MRTLYVAAHRRASRLLLVGLPLVALWACTSRGTPARPPVEQPVDTVAEPLRPGDITATMLRVAAEAADGYRAGREIHVLVTRGPNPRPSIYPTLEEARAASLRGMGAYVGAYRTPPDTLSPELGRVLRVQVTLLEATGDTIEWTVPLDSVDLIAWSMPAIEKFVVPYYARLYGADYAQRFRSQYFNTVPYLLYCHDLMSIECPTMRTETLEGGFDDR